ncbi:MAG: alpha/beta hydrolase-fold protein [Candidatus Omnitrophica bacterium]|nr:alpha/beta hydrolase-fold protein [Candidatus Omnitrophota bacterium]
MRNRYKNLRWQTAVRITAVMLFIFPGICVADSVRLKNGSVLEGIVLDADDVTVVIRVDIGKMTLPRGQVEEIITDNPQQQTELQQQWQQEKAARRQQDLSAAATTAPPEGPVLVVPRESAEITASAAQTAEPQPGVAQDTAKQARTAPPRPFVQKSLGEGYYLVAAPSAVSSGSSRIPLVIALHGYSSSAENFMEFWKFEAKRNNLIVACPQSRGRGWTGADSPWIFKMLDDLKRDYPVDSANIFVTGFSQGAHFVLYLGMSYPKVFRAAAAVAGSLSRARESIGAVSVSGHARIPVLLYIGTEDTGERRAEVRRSRDELRQAGYRVSYREIPNAAHVYMSRYSQEICAWLKTLEIL